MRAMLLKGLKRFLLTGTSLEAQLYPPLELPVRFRTFGAPDNEACLAIYRQNEPARFPPGYSKQFEAYLQSDTRSLVVAELDSRVIGFGGINLLGPEVAVLFFGMLAPEHQRKRIGATLTLLRLAQLPPQATGYFVFIFAVDASMRIYRRFGFIKSGLWQDDNGQKHPVGRLHVSDRILARIKSTLRRRGVQLEGELSLQASSGRTCTIERTAAGLRFHFGQGEEPAPSERV